MNKFRTYGARFFLPAPHYRTKKGWGGCIFAVWTSKKRPSHKDTTSEYFLTLLFARFMKKTPRSPKSSRHAFDFPVSEKFYNEIISRITNTFHTVPYYVEPEETTDAINQTVKTIETYLLTGCEPAETAEMPVRMVFALLKPELDKAMARSAAARRRRNSTQLPVKTAEEEKEGLIPAPAADNAEKEPVGAAGDTDATEVTEIMMNRRQRRRQERELRRRERRASSRTGLLRAKK